MVKFINSLFEKYKHLTPPNHYLKKAYQEILEEMFDVVVREQDIIIRGNTIFLTAPPALKSELFLHKQEVLKRVQDKISKTSNTTITDLR